MVMWAIKGISVMMQPTAVMALHSALRITAVALRT